MAKNNRKNRAMTKAMAKATTKNTRKSRAIAKAIELDNRNADKSYFLVARSQWDTAAVIFATFVALLELVFLFAKPTVSLFGTTVSVTSGIVAFAGLTGAMLWGIVEVMTPPRRHVFDIWLRFFGSFIIGFFIGGFLAFYFNFGQLVLVPSYHGNYLATFEVVAIFIAVVILVSNAAWAHNRGFVKTGATAR